MALNTPWLLNGDFNAISKFDEHRGGSFKHYFLKSISFSKFITDNCLFDLGFSGSGFTWCNGQSGLAQCWVRLDHFLANSEWILSFKKISNQHIP